LRVLTATGCPAFEAEVVAAPPVVVEVRQHAEGLEVVGVDEVALAAIEAVVVAPVEADAVDLVAADAVVAVEA